jgi:hypothetical protein
MSDDDRAADGLIDVSGLSAEELSALVDETDLGRALDHILAVNENSSGSHGFNNSIGRLDNSWGGRDRGR